jgi:hypothetical protein
VQANPHRHEQEPGEVPRPGDRFALWEGTSTPTPGRVGTIEVRAIVDGDQIVFRERRRGSRRPSYEVRPLVWLKIFMRSGLIRPIRRSRQRGSSGLYDHRPQEGA